MPKVFTLETRGRREEEEPVEGEERMYRQDKTSSEGTIREEGIKLLFTI